uniref:DUF3866 family protein n=1 Tax=Nocardiopsis sp. RV163 TaxID=1661388 RepID=UPI000B2616FE
HTLVEVGVEGLEEAVRALPVKVSTMGRGLEEDRAAFPVNAAAVLGGRPVASLRVSEADARERHRGVSHHSLTAYGRVALARAEVVVPLLPGVFGERVRVQAGALGERHTLVEVGVEGLEEAVRALPVKVSTMGRGLEEDRAAFLSAAAAGRRAAALL